MSTSAHYAQYIEQSIKTSKLIAEEACKLREAALAERKKLLERRQTFALLVNAYYHTESVSIIPHTTSSEQNPVIAAHGENGFTDKVYSTDDVRVYSD